MTRTLIACFILSTAVAGAAPATASATLMTPAQTHDKVCLVADLPGGQPLPDVCVIKPL